MSHPKLAALHNQLIDGLDFCGKAYAIFDEIANSSDGAHQLRGKGRPKKLVEEVFPICRYIQTFYTSGRHIVVRWLDDNQPYDAKVEFWGAQVDLGLWPESGTLEVTQAVHHNAYLMRELLDTQGGAFGLEGIRMSKESGIRTVTTEPTSYTNHSYIEDMCHIILTAIKPKAEKLAKGRYPSDTTLIVDCDLVILFFPDDWAQLIAKVKSQLPPHQFVRIFLTAQSEGYCTSL